MKLILKNNKNKKKVIRFRKKGILRYTLYDIVVTYKNLKNKGIALEKIGFFNPQFGVKSFRINIYRLSYWLLKGAFINYSVKKYLVKFLLY
jgi:ribosomal protein S16